MSSELLSVSRCDELSNLLFFVEKKLFRKENIQFSSSVCLFLILPMTHRIACRIVGVLYNKFVWGVTAVRKPEVAASNPAVGHVFYIFSDTIFFSFFNCKKKRQNFGFYDKWALFFLKSYPFCDVKETNRYF